MRKRMLFNFLMVSVICFSLLACSDDDPETDKNIIVANQEQLTQSVFADDLAGNSEVNFTTKGAWTSSISESSASNLKNTALRSSGKSSPKWISITPDAGKEAGDYTISINLAENRTKVDRTATITIVCGETQITITITQKATKKDGTVPEEKRGGTGKFIITDHFSNKVLEQIEVDEARIEGGATIWFYKDGSKIDVYMNMSSLREGSYTWCYDKCTEKYFYTQKGGTEGIMWYARGGTVDISNQNDVYSISVYLDTRRDYYDGSTRMIITGTYTGYLTTE